MKQKHNGYLDGSLTMTHEALVASGKAYFDYLKNKGQWGAKSPNDKKIVAMVAKISALKGQLKLDPKLSIIAEDKKKGNKGENKGKKKNKKDYSNKKYQKKDEAWKKVPPKDGEKKKGSGKIHLQLVQTPHGMDGSQAFRLHPRPEAQGRPEERRQQQSQLCCHCILGHHSQQSLRGPIASLAAMNEEE